jgi:glycosyltransferase involved in cell wall biosynthesis
MTDKLKILVSASNLGGCSYYRVLMPFEKLQELYPDEVEVRFNLNPLGFDTEHKFMRPGLPNDGWIPDWDFEDMKWADVIVTNNLSNYGPNYTARIVGKAKEFGKFVIYDTDDLLTNLYEGHRLFHVYKQRQLDKVAEFVYNHADLVTVTQPKFLKRIAKYCGNSVAMIRNAIDYNLPCWNNDPIPASKNKKRNKTYVRFGWVGGIHHEQDLKYFAGVPHMVNQKVGRENCRWDFYGHPHPQQQDYQWQADVWRNYQNMLTSGFRGGKNWHIHYATHPHLYGSFYASMDVALAPLEPNEFNDSKSEIKLAEAGRYGVPLIASDVGCYSDWIQNGKNGFLIDPKKGVSEWVRVLTRVAKDHDLRRSMGENLRELVNEKFDINKTSRARLDMIKGAYEAWKEK